MRPHHGVQLGYAGAGRGGGRGCRRVRRVEVSDMPWRYISASQVELLLHARATIDVERLIR